MIAARKSAQHHWESVMTTLMRSLLICFVFFLTPAFADSGPYVGASFGGSDLEFDVFDEVAGEPFRISDDQLAWKLFGGYRFDTGTSNLGIETGYVDLTDGYFITFGLLSREVDMEAVPVFGVAGVEAGPFNFFAKLGLVYWDAEVLASESPVPIDDTGVDLAYGAGIALRWGRVEFRTEYEVFDVDIAEDVHMSSLGIAIQF